MFSAPPCKKMTSRFVLYSKQCFRVNRQGHRILDLQNVVKKMNGNMKLEETLPEMGWKAYKWNPFDNNFG